MNLSGGPSAVALIAATMLGFGAARCPAFTVEAGGLGAGGVALAYGPYLDSTAQVMAEVGGASLTAGGSSQAQVFPSWSIGIYGQIDVLPWLAARLETRLSTGGFAELALTSAGAAFDQYGLSFTAVTFPLLARAHYPLGPGHVAGSFGPFLGILAGPLIVVDRRSSRSVTTALTPDLAHAFFMGLACGIGYALALGPGTAGIEIRADGVLTPVAAFSLGSGIYPVSVEMTVSYGMRIQAGRP